jgi:Sulfotransferase family
VSSSEDRASSEVRARPAQAIRRLNRQLEQINKSLTRQEEELAALRAMLTEREAGDGVEGIRPENIVWVFGSARTGSTWLSSMMKTLPNHAWWNEPMIGHLFGHFYYEQRWSKRNKANFILGEAYREIWLRSIQRFVLDGATARFPEVAGRGGYLVIKEPHGSIGAPLLMEALPESRMIFLVRDPRDVVASALHVTFVRTGVSAERREKAEKQPETLVRSRTKLYLEDINRTRHAFEAYDGRKVLVRYEDLKADTLEEMKRIYSALEIPVDEGELVKAVEKRSWENIPDEEKGPGKKRRKATAGGWREDLTPDQARIVEEVTRPLIEEFYS